MERVNIIPKEVNRMPSQREWKQKIKCILEEGDYEFIEEKPVRNQRVGISKRYNGRRAIVIIYEGDSSGTDGEGGPEGES